MEGAEFSGLAQEADEDEVDDAWARHRQQPKYPVRHEDVPKVAMCEGVRGAAQVQPYKKAFLAGYAVDHKPEGRPSRGDQCKFESLDPEDFETAKACQKEKFKYRKSRAGCDGEAPAAGVGQVSAATGVVRAGGLEPPSPRASVVQAPPRPHERAARLVREWAERAENPVVFNQEQMEVIALVVGQVERIVSHREAVERGDSPEPPEQMVLLLHGQGGSGKTEVVSLLRRLLREVFSDLKVGLAHAALGAAQLARR